MFRNLILAASLLAAAPALAQSQPQAQPQTTAPAADPDALCFVAAAVTARQLPRDDASASEADRSRRFLLDGVANFHAGRLSSRVTLEQLPAVLRTAVTAATRLNLGRHASECTERFVAFMRVVAAQN